MQFAVLELKVPPLAQVVILGVAMYLTSILLPSLSLPFPFHHVVGGIIFCASSLIAILGVVEFRKAKTTVDPRTPQQSDALVTNGIYQLTRNPMYLGFLFMLAGWFLMLGNLAAVIFLPIFVIYMNRFQIKPEELFLKQKFGNDFTQYCARVRRWL